MELLRNKRIIAIAIAAGGLVAALALGVSHMEKSGGSASVTTIASKNAAPAGSSAENPAAAEKKNTYPLHQNITATEFWVGEPGDADNGYIQNRSSTWVEDWSTRFGGVDDPDNRNGYLPAGFTPKENPFYFALPYSDLDNHGNQKPSAKRIPWYNGAPKYSDSIVKNRWIEVISKNGKAGYAQWEDAGPFGEDDFNYVFGSARPANQTNDRAGLDLSPASTDYLGLNGQEIVSWRFVDASQVPDGPWKQIVTNY
jgi:hypothetical protein